MSTHLPPENVAQKKPAKKPRPAKVHPVSGFPEWLPHQRRIELQIIETLRQQFESFGFLPIETRAIEPLEVLLSKGDDKEIYGLKRLHDDPEAQSDTASEKFGLHFDLTVPFARYVQENEASLVFPFKRYQIQKVWRGERKQEGRYREFYQCDIDIIGKDTLPVFYEAEVPFLLLQVMQSLPIPAVILKLSNRKVLEGFYRGLGIEAISETLRIVDKLAKIGESGVRQQLASELQLSDSVIQSCLALAQVKTSDLTFMEAVAACGVSHPLLEQGLAEMQQIVTTLMALEVQGFEVDFSIARGLDYYTGTVYEGYFAEHPKLGAVCSGGRYDNLAQISRHSLPGLGVSIGLTRILGYLFQQETFGRDFPISPAVTVMIILNQEADRIAALKVATTLRVRGIATDIYHQPQNFGKQMRNAQKRGIPYIWFLGQGLEGEVKHLDSGQQYSADANSWLPQ